MPDEMTANEKKFSHSLDLTAVAEMFSSTRDSMGREAGLLFALLAFGVIFCFYSSAGVTLDFGFLPAKDD